LDLGRAEADEALNLALPILGIEVESYLISTLAILRPRAGGA
jgi:hypothetical protein